MQKDFDRWNEQKKALERNREKPLFKEGEVWWCSVGINVGEESCGKGATFRRPVLILKRLSGASCIGIPLSTKIKMGTWFAPISIDGHVQTALLYQVRMFSTNRFQRRLAVLEYNVLASIRKKLEILLEPSHNHQGISPGSVGLPKNRDNDINSSASVKAP